jgi:hypothetical protein
MKEVKAFVCDFCPRKKRFAQRGTALRHESRCFYNPVRKSCATCKNFYKERGDKPDYSTGYPGDPGGLYCELGILPIYMGPEEPPKTMTSECEKWELRVEETQP